MFNHKYNSYKPLTDVWKFLGKLGKLAVCALIATYQLKGAKAFPLASKCLATEDDDVTMNTIAMHYIYNMNKDGDTYQDPNTGTKYLLILPKSHGTLTRNINYKFKMAEVYEGTRGQQVNCTYKAKEEEDFILNTVQYPEKRQVEVYLSNSCFFKKVEEKEFPILDRCSDPSEKDMSIRSCEFALAIPNSLLPPK